MSLYYDHNIADKKHHLILKISNGNMVTSIRNNKGDCIFVTYTLGTLTYLKIACPAGGIWG